MNNYSKQRELILEEIKSTKTHPTAEEIYILVTEKEPKISKSTVYRNISILVENQKIKKITTLNGADRFDYLHKPHHHIICNECGEVFDFEYDFKFKELRSQILEQTGVELLDESILMQGICKKCKSKKEGGI